MLGIGNGKGRKRVNAATIRPNTTIPTIIRAAYFLTEPPYFQPGTTPARLMARYRPAAAPKEDL